MERFDLSKITVYVSRYSSFFFTGPQLEIQGASKKEKEKIQRVKYSTQGDVEPAPLVEGKATRENSQIKQSGYYY